MNNTQLRDDTLTVITHHGTSTGATWAGISYATAWSWARTAGLEVPHGRTRAAREQAAPRPDCTCPMCTHAHSVHESNLRHLGTRPTSPFRARPPWMNHAACRGVNPALFFPERGETSTPAKQVCADCTVRVDCLEHALAACERHGVWGGQSERERRRLRARIARGEPVDLAAIPVTIRATKPAPPAPPAPDPEPEPEPVPEPVLVPNTSRRYCTLCGARANTPNWPGCTGNPHP